MVFGLGNPGERYAGTRHNVGFMVVDEIARQLGVAFKKRLFRSYSLGKGSHAGAGFHLVKPLTFMNNSGRIVREVLRDTNHPVSELIVVCDSLDLAPGSCRLRLRGSSGGQKGLESLIQALGSEDFMRMSVGIGRPERRSEVVGHVLTPPRGQDDVLIRQGVDKAVEGILLLLAEGSSKVMNEINRKESTS